jgi:general secretion pathway protein G
MAMPRTLVSCPRRLDAEVPAHGFTLVELLVVLALVALATGLIAPSVVRGIDAARERGARADIRALLEGMPVRAYQSGAAIEFDSAALRRVAPELPESWRIEVDGPLRYGPNGVAAGGAVRLLIPGREAVAWKIAAVSGQVEVVTARAYGR